MLWEEYLREHPDGYQNSQFCYHFHRWRKSAEVSMHIDHKAGEKLFVDYAGDRLAIVDPDSRKEQPVETFVADPGGQRADLRGGQRHPTKRRLDPLQQRGLRYLAAAPRSSSRTTCAARSVAATPTNPASTPSSTRSPRTMG